MTEGKTPRIFSPICGCMKNQRETWETSAPIRVVGTCISAIISLPPGRFGGSEIEQLFCNTLDWDAHPFYDNIRGLEVSAHLLVRRDGTLVQFVPLTERAWHAGESCFRRHSRCNDFSIGIELEGADDVRYEDAQYATLTAVIAALLDTYPAISAREIAAHSDISPGRKTDPGPAFDWLRLYHGLNGQLA